MLAVNTLAAHGTVVTCACPTVRNKLLLTD